MKDEDYHIKMITEGRTKMKHEYITQTNESFNTRNTGFAQKIKNFSRTHSLKYHIEN